MACLEERLELFSRKRHGAWPQHCIASCHWPFYARNSKRSACETLSTQDAVLSFVIGSLNSTVLAMPIEVYFHVRDVLPRLHWSSASSFHEMLDLNDIVSPLRLLPFSTVNQTRTSLKLIADEVAAKKIVIDLYLTPYDMLSWLGTSLWLICGTGVIVALLTKRRGHRSLRRMLKLCIFSLSHGHLPIM